MTAFYLTVSALAAGAVAQDPPPSAPAAARERSPDELYAQREDIASAKRAAELWTARFAAGADFDTAWKLARVCQFLGSFGPEPERRDALDRGVKAGEQAIALQPDKPDGHFWLAANMGTLAESFGVINGLKYRGAIRDELQKVIALAPGWQSGSAETALGQWYATVPGLFGGNRTKGVELLRQALTYNPDSAQALYSLAEILAHDGKTRDEAKAMLEQVLILPIDPEWVMEDRAVRTKAAALLEKLKRQYL